MNNENIVLRSILYGLLCLVSLVGLASIVATSGDAGFTPATTTSLTSSSSTTLEIADRPDYDPPYSNADYTYSATGATTITLNSTSIDVSGSGVTVSGTTATITAAGTYIASGTLNDGQINVNTQDAGVVKLVLDDVDVYCSNSAPVNIVDADAVFIFLEGDNYVADGSSYTSLDADGEPDATVFSKSDLVITGSGSLTVDANYNNAIKSKDILIIDSGTIAIDSVDDGITGRDYLGIESGTITIAADGDGLKSTNDEDDGMGYVYILDGVIDLTCGADAIQGATDVVVENGEFTIIAGGGNSASLGDDESAKGIKAGGGVFIDDGDFVIDTADDALHANMNMEVDYGVFDIETGDDGLHADSQITISGGDFTIEDSYEGIESAVILIAGGNIHLKASDDGINVSGGDSAMAPPGTTTNSNYYLYVDGGYTVVDSGGDGLDINGSAEMTAGTIIVNSPLYSTDNDSAVDYDGSFTITGGFLIGAGSSAMAEKLSGQSSTQNSMLVNFSSTQIAETLFHVESKSGTDVVTFAPKKQYNSVVFSSPDLADGTSYYVYLGGISDGTATDGLYQGGTYSPGTKYTTVSF